MDKHLIATKIALLEIYQAIKGKSKAFFNPLDVLQNLGDEKSITMKIYVFRKMGYLNYKPNVTRCQLTDLGFNKALKMYLKEKIAKKRWDGNWRFLIFDVPEEYRKYRDKLRRMLLELGCMRVQLSIWVSPVDVLEELKLLLPSFRVGDWVQAVKGNEVSNEVSLLKMFNLKKK